MILLFIQILDLMLWCQNNKLLCVEPQPIEVFHVMPWHHLTSLIPKYADGTLLDCSALVTPSGSEIFRVQKGFHGHQPPEVLPLLALKGPGSFPALCCLRWNHVSQKHLTRTSIHTPPVKAHQLEMDENMSSPSTISLHCLCCYYICSFVFCQQNWLEAQQTVKRSLSQSNINRQLYKYKYGQM